MNTPVLNKSVAFLKKETQNITQEKTGILLVAYGSSHMQASFVVRSFQARLEKDFEMPVRLAFTSETMRKRLAHAKTKSDSVLKALEKMYFERFSHVAVQTLHLIPGLEYHDVLGDIELAREKMPLKIEAGTPLLSKSSDMSLAAKALQALVPDEFAKEDLLLWMGHGTAHEAEIYYNDIAKTVNELDKRLFIACMEGKITLQTVLSQWKDTGFVGYKKVWLLPLLTTVGRHALHDMAGSQDTSWKSQLEKVGFTCQVHMHGLAESEFIQDIWIERLQSALESLLN